MTVDKVALRRARRLLAGANAQFLELGRLLRDQRKAGGFTEFCAEVPIHSRKAYDLVTIAEAVSKGRMTDAQVMFLGWTKAKMIASQTKSKKQAQAAVTVAGKTTASSLSLYLKGGKLGLVTKTFFLTEAESAEIDAALLRAGAKIKSGRYENRTEALMTVTRTYCAVTGGKGSLKLVAA